MAEKEHLLHLFYSFLSSIEIEVVEKEINVPSFLPGLRIENGKLVVDRQRLLYPGDLLHEAGHIAVTASAERSKLNDNVMDNRPGTEGEELAAMLWSYAVCLHLSVAPEVVFHMHGYKGDNQWILDNYKERKFIGLPLLCWMGMTLPGDVEGGFPVMRKWLRD